ncbi:FtsK/SpoIIIE family DNA translocase [Alkaliphilus transvaalensis]|uniref:FtsK/SpoIIIE family DNA translocase n=1 Tax=Alkaliphilus transvaalensis TaxID=114628 RepID=UPI00047C1A32|nr:DNA translocase FtsK [Alkaliphilus transvaalensis]
MRKNSRTKKDNSISLTKEFNHEIKGIFFIAIGLILLIAMHSLGAGKVGELVRALLMGLFSGAAYILPYITIACGVLIFTNTSFWKNRSSYVYFSVIFLCILFLFSLNNVEGIQSATFLETISNGFSQGQGNEGGGLVGNSITYLFVSLFGTVGTYIIVICLFIISTMIYTNVSLLSLLLYFKKVLTRIYLSFKDSGSVEKAIKEKKNKKAVEKQLDLFEASVATTVENLVEQEEKIKILDFTNEDDSEEDPRSSMEAVEGEASSGLIKKTKAETNGVDINKTVKNDEETGEINISGFNTDPDFEYQIPDIDLLSQVDSMPNKEDKKKILKKAKVLEETLKNFGVEAKVVQVSKGPVITRYELQPSVGVKVSKIVNLSDDIALNMAAPAIRIEAPIPGKAAIGIEIPNEDVSMVTLREVIDSTHYQSSEGRIPFALGKDISGNPIITDISKMPHLLVAGATGSGKSVCINTLILSILYSSTPENVKLLMIDPKVVELNQYNGIPHLLIPVVTDPKKATGALNWAVQEMTRRYQLFAENSVKDIGTYNDKFPEDKLPFIVIIIDELADLMLVAANDVEDAICRLAQMARAAGLHLIIATQRPSVDVITGVIKANIPSRIAFSVASQTDSRTIIDMGGAEKLLGKGDMLFYPIGANKPVRVQGAFVSEKEVERVVTFIKNQVQNPTYESDIINKIDSGEVLDLNSGSDDLFNKAVELIVESQQASISMLQRRLRIGYNRAARLIDEMEAKGIIGPHEGSKPRQVLIKESDIAEQNEGN